MKKKNVFLYLIILFVAFVFATDSASANSSYYVYKRSTSEKYTVPLHGGQTTLYFYTTKKDGQDITTTYCVDPARKWGGDVGNLLPYTVLEDFSNNTESRLYKEMAVAYRILKEKGYVNDGNLEHRAIGELVARWIITDSGFAAGENRKAYGNSDNFDGSNPIVYDALVIFKEVVDTVGRGNEEKSYNDLVTAGAIWGVQWGTVNYKEESTGSNTSKVTFILTPTLSTGEVKSIQFYYDQFDVKCTNTNVKCTKASQPFYGQDGIQVDMTVEKLNGYTGSDYGILVTPSYCSMDDIAFQMVLLQSADQPYTRQRMLMVSSTECPVDPMMLPQKSSSSSHGGHPDIPVNPGPSCICDTSTGLYKVTKDKTTTTYATLDEAQKAAGEKITCPGTCEKKKTCYKEDNGTPHCTTGEVCTEEQFKKECQHSCQNPSESGDGKYYCKESTPGAGDGKECSKEEYIKDCQKCDEWENDCKDGKNPDDERCKDYNQYCVDCTPNVYMPATCDNFDVDSTATGIVSDIREASSRPYSCDNSAPTDQVKSCVINHADAAGNSYNATHSSGIDANNPYCRIWCKETYQFGVPTARTTNSGSYFTIDASINGIRDCYASGTDTNNYQGIETMKFRQDIKRLIEEMITNHNQYMKYKTALDNNKFDADQVYGDDCHEDSDDCYCSYPTCHFHMVPSYSYTTWNATFDPTSLLMTAFSSSLTNASDNVNGEVTIERGRGYVEGNTCPDDDVCHEGDVSKIKSYLTTQRDEYKKKYEANLESIRIAVHHYNDCSGAITNDSLGESSKSTGWENKMVLWDKTTGPRILMNYDEDYIKSFQTLLNANYQDHYQMQAEMYCFGDSDSAYRCMSGGSANSLNSATMINNIVYCDDTHCYSMPITVGKSNWIRKTKGQKATYEPDNLIAVRSQYGTIQFNSPACNGNDCLYTSLPSDSIPVSLLKKTGVFPFKLTYQNVGQCSDATGGAFCNNDNQTGRLLNDDTSQTVVKSYTEKVQSGQYNRCRIATMQQQVGYVCHYLTNCDDHCDFKCDPDGQCYFEDCEDGYCKFTCRDCIFDGDSATYSFRPVSLNAVFPNERTKTSESGYNWTNDYKGQLTRKIIETGYQHGKINLSGGDEIYKNAEYSYTLSALNLQNIRKYNKAVGSFSNSKLPTGSQTYSNFAKYSNSNSNDAIYCSAITVNGIEYSVMCNSAFLDIIENEPTHEFAIDSLRPSKENRFILFTDLIDVDPGLQSSCSGYKCISRENALGPSWK